MRLGEICKIKYGKDHKKLNDGNIPVYGSGGIIRYVDTALRSDPSVLIPRKGTLGNLFFASTPFWTVDTLFYTDIDTSEVIPKFLYYQLKTKNLAELNVGTAVPSLTTEVLNDIEIDLPSLEKQKQVVEVLGRIDTKIEVNSKLNGYLLECMKANYRTLFAYEQTAYGSIYDIADVVYGAAFKSALFNEDGNGYPLIRIRDLTTYEPQYWTDEAHPKRTFIEPGDVVAGMDAEFSPTFWLGEKAVLNQRVCLFRSAADTAVSPSYLLFALSPLLAFIQNYATGTTVAHMGKGDLEALEVPLPLESDLKKFNAVAEPMRKQIVHNSLENKRLTVPSAMPCSPNSCRAKSTSRGSTSRS